jgi:2-keto-4-pentenoate hydratase
VPHENYCLPRVEIELAFILGKPLKGPGVQLHDVLRATDYVVPAIEIVDARLQDPRKIFDTVSDNGAAAGIVIGGRPVGPLDIDLRWVGGIMYRNSEIEETGVAAGVLGHPALGVAWLANKLGQHGVTLEPGHLVLAGSFTRVVHAKKGDTLHADFGALGGDRPAVCLILSSHDAPLVPAKAGTQLDSRFRGNERLRERPSWAARTLG